MTEAGIYTYDEILSQPRAWKEALGVLENQKPLLRDIFKNNLFDMVFFSGCGSTYYLSLAAAALFEELVDGWAYGIPASEIWLHPRAFPRKNRTLLAMISRSGETTESLHACRSFMAAQGGRLLTLTCTPGSSLAALGEHNLILPSGQEKSIAQTRAFSTLYLASIYLCCLWSERDDLIDSMQKLPEVAERLISTYRPLAKEVGRVKSIDRIYFLGSGSRYGLACELNLKMKEMSLSHSEAFHFLEFRHGPQSMVNEKALVIGLISDETREQEVKVLAEMRSRGARVVGMAEQDAEIDLLSSLPAPIRNILYLPIGQLIAFERSLDNGLNPDQPNNLQAVVTLD